MDVDDAARPGGSEWYAWAWDTPAGSGWIALSAIVDPPKVEADTTWRNPKPPREATNAPLRIDATAGLEKLRGLRHVNSQGVLPPSSGNRGEHYTSRRPRQSEDFVYLLFAVPNVQRGGVAKDSLPDGATFIPALDEQGRPIAETMTFYRDNDLGQPVKVTFLYGRAQSGDTWGWLARANVGDL
jgi:hypothetical protein